MDLNDLTPKTTVHLYSTGPGRADRAVGGARVFKRPYRIFDPGRIRGGYPPARGPRPDFFADRPTMQTPNPVSILLRVLLHSAKH